MIVWGSEGAGRRGGGPRGALVEGANRERGLRRVLVWRFEGGLSRRGVKNLILGGSTTPL